MKTIPLLMLLIILSGCTAIQTDRIGIGRLGIGGSEETTRQYGIKAEIESPPKENIFGRPFDVVLKLTNDGDFDLLPGDVKARIVGTIANDQSYIADSLEADNKVPLDKLGGTATINLGSVRHKQTSLKEIKDSVDVELCYPYQTTINSNIYISTKEAYVLKAKILSNQISKAPVQAKIEPVSTKDKVFFDIILDEKSNGFIAGQCWPDSLENNRIINIDILSPPGVYCDELKGSSGAVDMDIIKDKKVTCGVSLTDAGFYGPEGEENEHTEPLHIILGYNYGYLLAKNIIMK